MSYSDLAAIPAAGREAHMASKNRGIKNTKTAAAKDLKQKRREKKAKKSDSGTQHLST